MHDDLTRILEDLAAHRIDADEASRRMDLLDHPPASDPGPEKPAEPSQPATDAEPTWGSIARDLLGAATDLGQSVAQGAADGVRHSGARDFLSQQFTSLHGVARPQPDPAADAGPAPESPTGSNGVNRLVLRVTGRRVRLLGDHTEQTVSVSGEHELRREGDVLEVTAEQDLGPHLDPRLLLRGPRSLADLRDLGLGKEVVVRVNPAILVDVEATGASLVSTNVGWLGKVRITAGTATLGEVVEVRDALLQAGNLTLRGRFDRGRSRVRVESGNLVVQLAPQADVEVRGQAQLGRLAWPGGGDLDVYTAGQGRARLDIGVVMGAATISQPQPGESHEHTKEQEQR